MAEGTLTKTPSKLATNEIASINRVITPEITMGREVAISSKEEEGAIIIKEIASLHITTKTKSTLKSYQLSRTREVIS
jgi:hypothetical protein